MTRNSPIIQSAPPAIPNLVGYPKLVFHSAWQKGATVASGYNFVPQTILMDTEARWNSTTHQYNLDPTKNYLFEHQVMWDSVVRGKFASLRMNSAFVSPKPTADEFITYRSVTHAAPAYPNGGPVSYPGVFVNNNTGAPTTLDSGNTLNREYNRMLIWEIP